MLENFCGLIVRKLFIPFFQVPQHDLCRCQKKIKNYPTNDTGDYQTANAYNEMLSLRGQSGKNSPCGKGGCTVKNCKDCQITSHQV